MLQGRAEQIRFRLTGAEICYSGRGLSYGSEVLLALAGPAANLLWACVTVLAVKVWPSSLLYRFIGCHLTLALFNLLPALPLDGGRVLKALLESCFPLWGEQSARWISFAFGTILTATGAYFLKNGGNPTLLFAGLAILRHALPKSPLHPAKKLLK